MPSWYAKLKKSFDGSCLRAKKTAGYGEPIELEMSFDGGEGNDGSGERMSWSKDATEGRFPRKERVSGVTPRVLHLEGVTK